MTFAAESPPRKAKPATHSGQLGGGRERAAGRRGQQGFWRRVEGGAGRREQGAPATLQATPGGSAGGSNCAVVMATEALPNTARRVGGAEHAGYTHPVWA